LIFSEEIIQYSRTFAPQVQTSWKQAHAPLLMESFPKTPRNHLKHPGSVDLIATKQNKLPSFIDRLYDIGVCTWPSKCTTFCPTLHSLCLGKAGLPHLDLSHRRLRTIMWSSECLDNHPKETKKPIMSGHTWSDPLP